MRLQFERTIRVKRCDLDGLREALYQMARVMPRYHEGDAVDIGAGFGRFKWAMARNVERLDEAIEREKQRMVDELGIDMERWKAYMADVDAIQRRCARKDGKNKQPVVIKEEDGSERYDIPLKLLPEVAKAKEALGEKYKDILQKEAEVKEALQREAPLRLISVRLRDVPVVVNGLYIRYIDNILLNKPWVLWLPPWWR